MTVPADTGATFFSVIRWGSGRPEIPGVVYDQDFHAFFDVLARRRQHASNTVRRWRTLPREIYIVRDESLSDEAFGFLVGIVDEVNNEVLPAMFCHKTGPLPITTGPPLTTANDSREGAFVVRLWDGDFHVADYPMLHGDEIRAIRIRIVSNALERTFRARLKYVMAHEFFHGAFAGHVYDLGYSDSLMSNNSVVADLSQEERLASCIVYHDHTNPGNTAPDTNP